MKASGALILSTLAIGTTIASAATIVPRVPLGDFGFQITSGGPYDPFSGIKQQPYYYWVDDRLMQDIYDVATLEGIYTPDSLSIHAAAYAYNPDVVGFSHGYFGFTVTQASAFRYAWSQSTDPLLDGGSARMELTRQSASPVTAVMGCQGRGLPGQPGGCALDPEVGGFGPSLVDDGSLPHEGYFFLEPGQYELVYEMNADFDWTGASNGDFSFSMNVVPLPATLPLLLAGLGCIGTLRDCVAAVRRRARLRADDANANLRRW